MSVFLYPFQLLILSAVVEVSLLLPLVLQIFPAS